MLTDKIIEHLIDKLRQKNWKCSCDECLFSEFRDLTDNELIELVTQ